MDYTDYCKEIGIQKPVLEKIDEILEIFNFILPGETLEQIFVNDYINEDGTREYSSLIILSNNSICEAKDFMNSYKMDWISRENRKIRYWDLNSKDNKLNQITESSRMSINIMFDDKIELDIKASKVNCRHMLALFNKIRNN